MNPGPGGSVARGLVEWDVNPNPLRTEVTSESFVIRDGKVRISDAPGLGWTVRDDVLK